MSHGNIIQCDVQKYDDSVQKYECLLLFQDNFSYQCYLTRDDILSLQEDILSRTHEKDTLRKFSPQTDFANRIEYVSKKTNVHAPVYSSPPVVQPAPVKRPSSVEDLYNARENINGGKSIAHRMSLKEYAEANPQRTRLLNGKLFTPELIKKTERGGVPEALQ